MMGFPIPLLPKFLIDSQLGWSVSGMFYSLITFLWVEFAGFDLFLTAFLSGAGLCQKDGDWGTLIASWSSFDLISGRSFQLLSPQFCLLAKCHTAD